MAIKPLTRAVKISRLTPVQVRDLKHERKPKRVVKLVLSDSALKGFHRDIRRLG